MAQEWKGAHLWFGDSCGPEARDSGAVRGGGEEPSNHAGNSSASKGFW